MRIGTKSVLFGAHCFFLHPWFIAAAWWQLYGFPWDPRLWVAFVVHDLGYIGKPNMDGPEGETHPMMGARVMSALFDWWAFDKTGVFVTQRGALDARPVADRRYRFGTWGRLALLHSRFYAKALGMPPSRLCAADKLAIALTPAWLYLPMARATGELAEYRRHHDEAKRGRGKYAGDRFTKPTLASSDAGWYARVQDYCRRWAHEHKDGKPDTWTGAQDGGPNDETAPNLLIPGGGREGRTRNANDSRPCDSATHP